MRATFSTSAESAIPIHVIASDDLDDWMAGQAAHIRGWLTANQFKAGLGTYLTVPDTDGALQMVVAGWGTAGDRARSRFHFGALQGRLPDGDYAIAGGLEPSDLDEAALAWLLNSYRFDRYKKGSERAVRLVAPEGVDARRLEVIAAGVARTADLINTPASDMGPDALEAAFADLASAFGAKMTVVRGSKLLDKNFPMIHAVGRASDQAPRLLDLVWGGTDAPLVALVGKGV